MQRRAAPTSSLMWTITPVIAKSGLYELLGSSELFMHYVGQPLIIQKEALACGAISHSAAEC